MISLRRRLGRGLMTVLSVIFILHWVAADWVIRSVAEKQISNRLKDDAYSLMETLEGNDDDSVHFSAAHVSAVYNRPLSGHFYEVKVDARTFPSASLVGQSLDTLPLGPDQFKLYHLEGPEERPLMVLGLGTVKFGHRININVAEDLSAVDHDITTIRIAYLSLTLLILGCAITLQRWDIGRSMCPILAVQSELENVAVGLQQQISVDVPVEIRPLVIEINRLLELVEKRLQQSRTAMGTLAHALKTPVAMLFKITESSGVEERSELRQQMQAQVDAIHHCIERELRRARIAGNQQSGEGFNPHRDMVDLTRLMRNIHAERCLDIGFAAPDSMIHFDREDMLEMIGNLLDNACKWATHSVFVDIVLSDTVTVEVADDGPGCSELDIDNLTLRGARFDESVQGHGLGLAIVFDIVNVYKGELRIGRSQGLGGFSVTVKLPLHA